MLNPETIFRFKRKVRDTSSVTRLSSIREVEFVCSKSTSGVATAKGAEVRISSTIEGGRLVVIEVPARSTGGMTRGSEGKESRGSESLGFSKIANDVSAKPVYEYSIRIESAESMTVIPAVNSSYLFHGV